MITKNIVAYGIFDYTKQLQEAFDEGFRADLEDNLRAPMSFGALFEVTLVKEVVEETPITVDNQKPVSPELEQQVNNALGLNQSAKRGRKAST